MNFKETQGSSYDTIGDFFLNNSIRGCIEEYKKVVLKELPDHSYDKLEYGDIIREIFTGILNKEAFLKILQKNIILEDPNDRQISIRVALILALSEMAEYVDDTPVSIEGIMSAKILNLIQRSRATYFKIHLGNNQKINIQKYDGIRSLMTIGFPSIDAEGNIIYYVDGPESDGEYVRVFNSDTMDLYYIDITGKKREVQDDSKQKSHAQGVLPAYIKGIIPGGKK